MVKTSYHKLRSWRSSDWNDVLLLSLGAVLGVILIPDSLPGQWKTAHGPQGACILSCAVDSSQTTGDVILAGTYGGGVYLSRDEGEHWLERNNGMTYCEIKGVLAATSPAAGTIYLAASDEEGLFASTDMGEHWHPSNNGLPTPYLATLDKCVTEDGRENVFVGTQMEGVFFSSDQGHSWAARSTGLTIPNVLNFAVGRNTMGRRSLFVGTVLGLFRSTNYGMAWEHLPTGPIDGQVLAMGTFLGRNGESCLLVSQPHGLFLSSNDGDAFKELDPLTGWFESLAALPSDSSGSKLIISRGSGVMISRDYGNTWTLVDGPSGIDHITTFCAHAHGTSNSVFAGTWGDGMLRYDGSTWTSLTQGLQNVWVRDIVSNDPTGKVLYSMTFASGLFRSTDYGQSWTPRNSGLPKHTWNNALAIGNDPAGREHLYLSMGNVGVLSSSDGGSSWGATNSGLPLGGTSGRTLFLPKEAGTVKPVLLGTSDGTYCSTNSGAFWTRVSDTLMSCFAERRDESGRIMIYGGADRGRIFSSTDNGLTWSRFAMINRSSGSGRVTVSYGVGALLFMPSGRMVVSADFVYCYDEQTQQWAQFGTGLPGTIPASTWITGLSGFESAAGFVFFLATSDSGVYCLREGETLWRNVSEGLQNRHVASLAILSDGSQGFTLFAGTNASGIWKRPISEVLSSVMHPTSSLEMKLQPNFPNPFNASTTIRYSLPHRSHVSLAVFNTLGQKVTDLVDGEVDAGYHDVRFDAGHLASGVYFYRLQAGSFQATKRLVVTK